LTRRDIRLTINDDWDANR